ncbi:MAG: DEAD/DEAH box helicase [Bacilli bacterium]
MFVCEKCGNSDKRYIGVLNGQEYCRKCIEFIGEEYGEDEIKEQHSGCLDLTYKLTKEQEKISSEIVSSFKDGKNTLVKAVCGAGKTELVFKVIDYALKNKMNVGFAVPRKNVVLDLYTRFKNSFKGYKITPLYGGCTDELKGDIILLTTHQLYRYSNYFDLLILDEVDAFPFYKNDTLYAFFRRSLKGKAVILSATAPLNIIEEFKKNNDTILNLNVRFHHYKIPEPIIIKRSFIFQLIYVLKKLNNYQKQSKQCFVFLPTINMCEVVYKILKIFNKRGFVITSKTRNFEKVIEDFKNKKIMYLVTTSVLERGVTFKDLQVIILNSEHFIYDKNTLIQISGRVGRKKDSPNGDVIYCCNHATQAMKEAIYEIRRSNKYL